MDAERVLSQARANLAERETEFARRQEMWRQAIGDDDSDNDAVVEVITHVAALLEGQISRSGDIAEGNARRLAAGLDQLASELGAEIKQTRGEAIAAAESRLTAKIEALRKELITQQRNDREQVARFERYLARRLEAIRWMILGYKSESNSGPHSAISGQSRTRSNNGNARRTSKMNVSSNSAPPSMKRASGERSN